MRLRMCLYACIILLLPPISIQIGNIVQDRKSYRTQTDVKFVAGSQELWIPFNSIPQIDINAELEVAVRNTKEKSIVLRI